MDDKPENLRKGWTTGACAAAAAKAACRALLGGAFDDPVTITLPKGQRPSFALELKEKGADFARAGVRKNAGDDPDVTHNALIVATVRRGAAGTGVTFTAGEGVGMVTKPGLPIEPGEPAINPGPRGMIRDAIAGVAAALNNPCDFEVEISVPGGEKLAAATWNPRLGIVGGISILGTTGIVVPYSCSAWIHSIRSGIDVARATNVAHIAGCTGSTSERGVRELLGLPEDALIDMGDFAGGMLKYLRDHPVPRLTIGGGFAKLTKLGQGAMDLHSGRSQVDMAKLAQWAADAGADEALCAAIRSANTAAHALSLASESGVPLADAVAMAAKRVALDVLDGAPVQIEVAVFDREGKLVGRT
ncbi:MAG: cobalt-precorrin-5B (C(1))-methyltransferase [Rhodospirillales bacterium]|nr:cobalt-precorrin-5B (C(1))-methyltransferase [Rhodospirillales bacterium]